MAPRRSCSRPTRSSRVVAIVPLPRARLTRYFGVLAPAFAARSGIVPAEASTAAPAPRTPPPDEAGKRGRPGRAPWESLIWRVFRNDVLECGRCGGRMDIIAAVVDRSRSRASWSTCDCRPPLPPSTQHARRPRPSSRSPRAGSEPTHQQPTDSSPTHRRPTTSGPDAVPALTTPSARSREGRAPVRPDADAVLVFPAGRGSTGAGGDRRSWHSPETRPLTPADKYPYTSCTHKHSRFAGLFVHFHCNEIVPSIPTGDGRAASR
jgi:hypothetical protein